MWFFGGRVAGGGVNSESVDEFWWNMILGIEVVGLILSGELHLVCVDVT